MKLLLCMKCDDIFNLRRHKKTCSCGEVAGQYESDGWHAWFKLSEYAVPIGFANPSFLDAIRHQPPEGQMGREFTAFIIQENCPTFKEKP